MNQQPPTSVSSAISPPAQQNVATIKGGGGGGMRIWIYLSLSIFIIALVIALGITIWYGIKNRKKNLYLPSYPLPAKEVYIVLLDEGGVGFFKNTNGEVIQKNGTDAKDPVSNVNFTSGETAALTSYGGNISISFSKYASKAAEVMRTQAFKYAFGDDKGYEKVVLATKTDVENSGIDLSAVKIIANYGKRGSELANVGAATGGVDNIWGVNDKGGSAWLYTADGFHQLTDTTKNTLGTAGSSPDESCKVLAIAFIGPKQPPTDFNSRQYDFDKTYKDETSNVVGQVNGPTNSARPAITFKALSEDLSGSSFSSVSFIFRFRILPYKADAWSSVYGNDFRKISSAVVP